MNVKAGQKAILIKALNSNNLMKVVSVDIWFGDFIDFKDCWEITMDGGFRICPDAWLRPVSDIPDELFLEESSLVEDTTLELTQ